MAQLETNHLQDMIRISKWIEVRAAVISAEKKSKKPRAANLWILELGYHRVESCFTKMMKQKEGNLSFSYPGSGG